VNAWRVLFFSLLLPLVTNCANDMNMKSIQEVKRFHEARLMALPDVVSVGIGLNEAGDAAVIVGLARENTATRAHIPQRLEEYPVVVRITGSAKAE